MNPGLSLINLIFIHSFLLLILGVQDREAFHRIHRTLVIHQLKVLAVALLPIPRLGLPPGIRLHTWPLVI